MPDIGVAIKSRGFSDGVAATMLEARRPSSRKQYQCYLEKWREFCSKRNYDYINTTIAIGLEFLQFIFKSKDMLSYSTVNTARSALSSFVNVESGNFGTHRDVKLFMRGVFNLNPPAPKYAEMWDPEKVLTFLRTWTPAKSLTLRQLTLKLVLLILLTTGQRCHTLTLLSLADLVITEQHYSFYVKGLLKQSRPGCPNTVLKLKAYPLDRRLCVFTYMKAYLERTEPIRGDEQKFLMTFQKPHHPPSRDTISRWVKIVLQLSGININIYGAHSVRGASTSAARVAGVPTEDILAMAGCTQINKFSKSNYQSIISNIFAEKDMGEK